MTEVFGFPWSKAEEGSVIPGRMIPMNSILVNSPDGFTLVERKKVHEDVVVKHPSFNGEHTPGSSSLEKLKNLLAGKPESKEHPMLQLLKSLKGQQGPQMKPGYELFKENRDWRK